MFTPPFLHAKFTTHAREALLILCMESPRKQGAAMRNNLLMAMPVLLTALTLAACNSGEPGDTVTAKDSYGASPALPEPQHSRIPTVNIATAVGWPEGGKPKAADGMAVTAFASGLDHPRTV